MKDKPTDYALWIKEDLISEIIAQRNLYDTHLKEAIVKNTEGERKEWQALNDKLREFVSSKIEESPTATLEEALAVLQENDYSLNKTWLDYSYPYFSMCREKPRFFEIEKYATFLKAAIEEYNDKFKKKEPVTEAPEPLHKGLLFKWIRSFMVEKP